MKKVVALSVMLLALVTSSSATSTTSYRNQAWNIISHTFPAATRYKAFEVAVCETGGFTDFWNDRSHAKGLFQEMPGNDGRTLYWNHRKLTINWKAIRSDRPDWYAAKVALYQSDGGYRWSEWVCG